MAVDVCKTINQSFKSTKREAMVKILDWMNRLLLIYSYGENSLPRELVPIINRYKSREITDGFVYYLYNKSNKDKSIDAVYEITIPQQISLRGLGYSSEIVGNQLKVYFVIIDDGRIVVENFADKIVVFINKETLEGKDTTKSLDDFIYLVNGLYTCIYGKIYEEYFGTFRREFIKYTFLKFCFTEKALTQLKFDIETKIVASYIDKSINIDKTTITSCIDSIIRLVEGETVPGFEDPWRHLAKNEELYRYTIRDRENPKHGDVICCEPGEHPWNK